MSRTTLELVDRVSRDYKKVYLEQFAGKDNEQLKSKEIKHRLIMGTCACLLVTISNRLKKLEEKSDD